MTKTLFSLISSVVLFGSVQVVNAAPPATDKNNKADSTAIDMLRCPASTSEAYGVKICIKDGEYNVFDKNMFNKSSPTFTKTLNEYFLAPNKYDVNIEILGSVVKYKKDAVISQGYWDSINVTRNNQGEPGLVTLPTGEVFAVVNHNDINLGILVPNALKEKNKAYVVFHMTNADPATKFELFCDKETCEVMREGFGRTVAFEKVIDLKFGEDIVLEQEGIKLKLQFNKKVDEEQVEMPTDLQSALKELQELKKKLRAEKKTIDANNEQPADNESEGEVEDVVEEETETVAEEVVATPEVIELVASVKPEKEDLDAQEEARLKLERARQTLAELTEMRNALEKEISQQEEEKNNKK